MQLEDALDVLARHRTDEVVIATMSASVHWPSRSNAERDLVYYAPMGSASSVGLGLALARPDVRVVVLDGDGSLLMNLGSLVTIGSWQPSNLVHVVLDNGRYAVTGGQRTPTADSDRLVRLATAAGIPSVQDCRELASWQQMVPELLSDGRCRFVRVAITSTYDRVAVPGFLKDPAALSRHTGTGYWNLRRTLEGVPPMP